MRLLGIITSSLVTLTVLCGALLTSFTVTAETKKTNLSVTIPISCTMSGTVDTTHTASLQQGTYSGASGSPYANGIGKTTLTTFCTDKNGFAIYAIGNTNNVEGTNTMVGTTSGATINTKAYESTDTVSNWAMKVTKVTDSSESYLPQNMSILGNYDSWHAVPSSYTKVAQYHATAGSSVTDDLLGAKVETTYAVYVSTNQTPDSYTGQVKYVLVHPYNGVSPDTDEYTTTVTLGANITKVTFISDITEPQTVKTSGGTVSLYDGVTYTITATTADGYELASWTTDQYGTIGNATQNPTTFTATGTTTLSATAQEQLPEHTCTKEYRLQNADGTYPATYTADGTETLRQGSTCTYAKSVENYQTQEDTATMTTDQTISLDLPRNTYELTVNKDNTNITTATGAGTYRWGEAVNISATPATGSRFTTWTQTSGTTSTFADATSATTTFTMPTSAATITATGEPIPSYNVTVTLDSNTTSVSFYNATYGTQNITTSGSAASLRSGVEYTITATTASGYELNSWTAGTNATIGSTTTNPTTLTVTGTSTLSASSHEVTQSSCAASPMISTVASGITYMQDINSGNKSTVLSALTQDATYQIKDNRDNETYCVGKLADGNLWLLDNLALDLTSSTVLGGMNESNTNASNTTLGYLKNGGGTASDQYAITGVVNWTDSPTYASSYSCSDPLVNLTDKNVVPTDATSQAGQYKVGGYYNYCAATAGSYCYGNGTSFGTSSGNATEDICPKGWRMPTGNTTGEYQVLYNNASYNTYANYRSALHLPLSGGFDSGSVYSQGSYGYWRSSTRYDSGYMYTPYANTSDVNPASIGDRGYGISVRCVLDPAPTTETLTVSLDSNVTSVTFSDGMSPDQTVTTNGGTVNLTPNTSYTITATTASGYEFSSWTAGANATLGSTTANPTTLTITAATTLSVISQQIPSYNVTVTLDSNTTSVGFYNATYGTQNITTSGDTASLRSGVEYTITATTASGYEFSSWTPGTGATLGSATANPTTLTVMGPSTLSATSREEGTGPQPATAGCINYFANASTAVGTMGCQSKDGSGNNLSDGASATLLASNFSRIGYGFAGWSDSFDYATNPSAKFYGPQETITVPTGTTANGLSLYAVWIKSQGSIQDQSKVASVCSSLTTAPTDGTANLTSVSALTDQRDNNTYAIAKLADGNCWMIENLRLESTAEHNSDGTLAQGYGTSATYGNFGGLADAESANFENSTTANSLYYSGTQSGTASIDIGTSDYYPGYRMPRYNNLNTSTRASNPTINNQNMYSYGNYYTWHAAIADLTYNGTTNQSTTGTSLCPAGWHLPKGGDKSNEANNELWSLAVDGVNGGTKPANYDSLTRPYYTGTPEGSDASKKLRAYPNNFLYSGYFGTSSTNYRGSYGYYWSSTASSSSVSYYLYLSSSSVYPGTNRRNKYFGISIRCTVGS